MPAITPWSLVVHGQRTQSDGRKRRVRSEGMEQSSGSVLNLASGDSADRSASSGSPSILCSCYNPCARTSPCVAHRRRQSSLHDGVSILWSSCAVARIGLPHANGEGSSRRCDLELVRARGTANVRAQAKPNQFPRYHPRPFSFEQRRSGSFATVSGFRRVLQAGQGRSLNPQVVLRTLCLRLFGRLHVFLEVELVLEPGSRQ